MMDPAAGYSLSCWRTGTVHSRCSSEATLFEDCDQQRVTTKNEIEAITSFVNFLALMNG